MFPTLLSRCSRWHNHSLQQRCSSLRLEGIDTDFGDPKLQAQHSSIDKEGDRRPSTHQVAFRTFRTFSALPSEHHMRTHRSIFLFQENPRLLDSMIE